MSRKFRNSLFGFNRDDVLSYMLEVKENEVKTKQNIEKLNKNALIYRFSSDESYDV